MVLRIEDTDRERSTEAHTRVILDGLGWLGITWDEGPFFQGEYGAKHRADAEGLLAAGKAYRCFCTQEELDAQRDARGGRGRGVSLRPALLSALRRRGRDPARGRQAVHHPLPAGGGGARLGRRGARPHQLSGARPRRLRDPPERRHRHLQSRRRERRHRHADLARDPRRRPHLQHAEADRAVPRAGPADAGLRPRADDPRHRRQEAVEAPWRHRRRRLSERGHLPGRHAQLPRAARLVAGRRSRDPAGGGDDRAVLARGHPEEGGGVRYRQARVDERPVPLRAARGRARAGRAPRAGADGRARGRAGPVAAHRCGEVAVAHHSRDGGAGRGPARSSACGARCQGRGPDPEAGRGLLRQPPPRRRRARGSARRPVDRRADPGGR